MLSAAELIERRQVIADSEDLQRLLDHLRVRNARVLHEMPVVPEHKALLSVDGGVCADDGTALWFDPWSPRAHHCPHCGREHGGARHDRHWARFQHLWLGERMADLAALAALGDDAPAAERAGAILREYGARYLDYPNCDNVLGPSRLFFSTYLESVWIGNCLTAAFLLREADLLDEETAGAVSQVADEAANIIGEFDEGPSNRQVWHDAALAAIAVWFEDQELAERAIEGPTGLLAHLVNGFGPDGMWYEGENYHLFALQGLLRGFGWSRQAGVDPLGDPRLAARIGAALRAPALTALPDHTFPARKDSRFGVSLAQPMYLELWEVGLARLRDADVETGGIEHWLATLYQATAPVVEQFESYLHETGEATREARTRADLSSWALLEMPAELAGDPAAWRPKSLLLEAQGLAVLRTGGRYASVECGVYGGGHGHPDRLHLTLFERGAHWLPDPGTGSYVSRDLFWYRSTLAHNAPRLEGRSQPPGDARCEAFDADGDWAWARGSYGEVSRTVVSGPGYLLDLIELSGEDERTLELPWHFQGRIAVTSPGRWEPDALEGGFVTEVERFVPETPGSVDVTVEPWEVDASELAAPLHAQLSFDGELLRATGPGTPGRGSATFLVARSTGRYVRMTAVLATGDTPRIASSAGDLIEVATAGGVDRHRRGAEGWDIEVADDVVRLRGQRAAPRTFEPLIRTERPIIAEGTATWVGQAPAIDGTLDGFDLAAPLLLDHEDQYRRSEEPYAGPDEFAATAYANWSDSGLYLAVEVAKPEVILRPDDAPPLLLDNEPDEIHSDGLQIYLASPEHDRFSGLLIVPSTRAPGLRVRAVSGTAGTPDVVRGAWQPTDTGYRVTLAIEPPDWSLWYVGNEIAFDLVVNEMRSGRERRAGQLVWTGGSGWVWLRGDRHDPGRLGVLRLQ